MIIYIGSDHRGFQLKESLKEFLTESGYTVNDMGNDHYDENDNFVDFSKAVAQKVTADLFNSKGIVICGSGVGVDIVANRFPSIRSAFAFSPDQAMASRNDDDANVLAIAADFIGLDQAKKIVGVWLQTPFSNEEHYKKRIQAINELDTG